MNVNKAMEAFVGIFMLAGMSLQAAEKNILVLGNSYSFGTFNH